MQQAAFSIKNYYFDKIAINLDNKTANEISLSFNTSGYFHTAKKEYQLVFSITVFNEEKTIEEPFLHTQCIGTFSFKNVDKLANIPDFFYSNAIAILFPYLRAYVSLITTQANIPGLILPTLNLSSLGIELRNNTLEK